MKDISNANETKLSNGTWFGIRFTWHIINLPYHKVSRKDEGGRITTLESVICDFRKQL